MASATIHVSSSSAFATLLKTSRIVVVDFYADWCGPCKQIAPVFEQLSQQLSRKDRITFAKVDTDNQKELASKYNVTTLPTFMVFRGGEQVEKLGPDPRKLSDVIRKLIAEMDGSQAYGAGPSVSVEWRKADLPKGYSDVTDQVDVKGLELLNSDNEFGGVRTLVDGAKPSALNSKGKAGESKKDWVESDTDEQLMMFMPFQAQLKVHTLQITSLPPSSSEDDEEIPMRPKTLNLYINTPHILGFEEAEGMVPTQAITLSANDWDATGTAIIPLRFVKFQNVTSLVFFCRGWRWRWRES